MQIGLLYYSIRSSKYSFIYTMEKKMDTHACTHKRTHTHADSRKKQRIFLRSLKNLNEPSKKQHFYGLVWYALRRKTIDLCHFQWQPIEFEFQLLSLSLSFPLHESLAYALAFVCVCIFLAFKRWILLCIH